jgi:hypothetical protein
MSFGGRLPEPTPLRTDQGDFLVTHDQERSGTSVAVDLAVADENAWVVIYGDDGGQPGRILGQTWIPAGFNRDVRVRIDPELATETLHAVLHTDSGTLREFDFPNGLDSPMLRGRNIIQSPFILLQGDES